MEEATEDETKVVESQSPSCPQLAKTQQQADGVESTGQTNSSDKVSSDFDFRVLFEKEMIDTETIQTSLQDLKVRCELQNVKSVNNNYKSQQIPKTFAATNKLISLNEAEDEKTCTFSYVGCRFKPSAEKSLESHLQKEMSNHLDLILKTTLNLAKWKATELHKQTRIYETLLAFCHKHVKLEQKNRALELRLDALQRRVDEKSTFGELEFRPTSGAYCWRIYNFSQVVTDAILQARKNVYSPNFYTKVDGYCLCLRMAFQASLNLSDVEVGLFVHFVRGNYDDYLVWPFQGTIRLSISDQNEHPSLRIPIVEQASVDSDLQAFQRVTGDERNPHGFGYKKFVTTCILQSGTYIRDDTLIVQCEVKNH